MALDLALTEPLGVCSVENDTRELARLAADGGGERALDMGTGTGYVAIYLAQRGWAVDAVDVSPRALEAARANAEAARVTVRVYHSNLFAAVEGRYDVIAFNPPMNARESELTRWVTSTLRRWTLLARLLMRLGEPVRSSARDRFLVEFLRQARAHLTEGGRVLMVLSPREIEALTQAVPEAVVCARTPVPALPPLEIATIGYRAL